MAHAVPSKPAKHKRLTALEWHKAARMLAAGKSERRVADALGVPVQMIAGKARNDRTFRLQIAAMREAHGGLPLHVVEWREDIISKITQLIQGQALRLATSEDQIAAVAPAGPANGGLAETATPFVGQADVPARAKGRPRAANGHSEQVCPGPLAEAMAAHPDARVLLALADRLNVFGRLASDKKNGKLGLEVSSLEKAEHEYFDMLGRLAA